MVLFDVGQGVFGLGNGFELILAAIGLLVLIVGSITDFRTHEVPDWISFSFIAAAIGARLVYSSVTGDWLVFGKGLLGFGIFFGIGCLMFYTGQWGGGDSKVLMGLGALFGVELSLTSGLLSFFVNSLILGAVYGLIFSVYLAATNWRAFGKQYLNLSKTRLVKMSQIASFVVAGVFLILLFITPQDFPKIALFLLGLLLLFSVQLWVFTKSVESACMIKKVSPDKLTEGDWIVKDIKYQGKRITGPKDLGISKAQIRKLVALQKKGKMKSVTIKVGIPFVPAFLLGYIATLLWGNLFLVLMYLV